MARIAGESGAIRISTKLDNSGVIHGVKSLSSIFGKAEKSLGKIISKGDGLSKPFLNAQQKAKETEIAIDALKQKMESIENAGENSGNATSKAYENATSKIKQTELAVEQTAEKMDAIFNKAKEKAKFNSFGNGKEEDALLDEALSSNKAYQSLGNQLDRLNLKLDQQKIAAQSAKQQAIDATGTQGAEYQKLGNDVDKLNIKLEQYKSRMESASVAESGNIGSISRLKAGLQSMSNKFKEVGNKALKSFGGSVKRGLSSAGNSIKNMMNHTSKADSSVSKLFNRIKSLAGAAFVFNILRKAFSSIASYLNGAISGNKQFSNSLAQVKGNLLTAFAPIFSAVMPALNALMSVLAKVTGYIAAFVSMLFGKSISASKASANALNNQAKGYGAAGNAAKKAAGALADFDELSVLQSQEDSSGGGGGASVAPDFGMDLSAMEDYFAKFDSLKDAFYNIGASIAESINNAFNKIDWDGIQKKVYEWSTAIAALFNGFVDKLDWDLMGTTLGQGINTVLLAVNTFVREFNWSNLALGITNGLNSAIATVNWFEVGAFFANKFKIAIDMLYTFVTTFNWSEFGESISVAVNSWFEEIDWVKAVQAIQTGILGSFDTVQSFIGGVKWSDIGKKIGEMINAIDWISLFKEIGETISVAFISALSLLNSAIQEVNWTQLGFDLITALVEMVASIDWGSLISKAIELLGSAIGAANGLFSGIAMAIFEGFKSGWEGIKSYFSQFIEDAGGNIIQGLFNGIINAISAIGTWIKTNICDPFINGFKNAFGIHSPSTLMSEMGTYIIEGLLQGIQNMIASLVAILESIKTTFINVFNAIKTKIEEIFNSLKEFSINIWNNIKLVLTQIITSIKDTFTNIFTGVKDSISNIFNAIKSFVVSLWNSISTILGGIVQGISNTFTSVFEGMKNSVISIFDGIWNGIKKVINSILGGVEKMANGVINGLNSMINAMNNLSFDVPSWVPVIGGNTFGFSIPSIGNVSIPRLAQGAVIPANNEFMAVLGDQKSGRNLEAPESLIRQIVREETAQTESGDIVVKIEGNLGALARVLKVEAERETTRIGGAMIGGLT